MKHFDTQHKISHVWSVICTDTSIDENTKNVSLFNVIEQLEVRLSADTPRDEKLNIPLNYKVVTLWCKHNEKKETVKAEQKLVLFDPNGLELAQFVYPFEILKEQSRFRLNMQVSGLPLTVSGEYLCAIFLREEGEHEYREVAEIPLEIGIS